MPQAGCFSYVRADLRLLQATLGGTEAVWPN